MSDFLAMGGYGAYVWPAYALAAAVMIGLLVASLRGLRTNEATLQALEAVRTPRRQRRAKTAQEETGGQQPAPAAEPAQTDPV